MRPLLRVHGMEHFRTTVAKQARLINKYKNVEYRLLKTKAAVWFDTICRKSTNNFFFFFRHYSFIL